MTETLLGVSALLLVLGTFAVWGLRIKQVQIPANRLGFVLGWSSGALLGLIALATQGGGWLAAIPAVMAVLGGTFLCALVYVSPQAASDDAIRVGESLRAFTALDENGDEFSSVSLEGRPVLMKFFRGHW
ncbi:MAG: hypothetical protein OSB70_15295 [Myxococcota bacterium]|nr:hypothetical protein [Myxococcota bacterium]